MELRQAVERGEELKRLLTPFCDRVEIAGSVRRGKLSNIKDIELVAIPKIKGIPTGVVDLMTGEERIMLTNGLDWFMHQAFDYRKNPAAGLLFKPAPPNKAGSKAPFSERYYKFLFEDEPVDLFCVLPPAQFGAIYTIRTGDAGFSHSLVQKGYERGIHQIDGHLERWTATDGQPVKTIAPVRDMKREVLNTPEEEHYFQMLGVPWVAPELRVTTSTTVEEWEAATV